MALENATEVFKKITLVHKFSALDDFVFNPCIYS